MVSAAFFILRKLTLASFYKISSLWVSAEVQGVLLVCATSFYAVVRPYKHIEYYNADSSIARGNVILFAAESHLRTVQAAPYHVMVSVLVVGTPHMILLSYISYLFAKKAGITQCLKRKVQKSEKSVQNIRQKSV